MCGYFCIGVIDFMFEGKTLTKYTNLFSPNNSKKNDDIISNYFYGQYLKLNHIVQRVEKILKIQKFQNQVTTE